MRFQLEPAPRRVSDMAQSGLLPILMIAAAWWLLTRPYHGIWHDGLLYSVQALRRLHPENYARDVFFLYGSQDDFTLFSVVQAWLTARVGLEHAFLLLSVAGAMLWCYALLRLLRRWTTAVSLAASVILVLSADPHYGGLGVFAFGERFATPRIFSEALVLLALSWWLEGRRLIAGCAVFAAGIFHPLITIAGVGIIAWAILRTRVTRGVTLWLTLLGLSVLGMLFLSWFGISPWLDPDWRQLVSQRSPFLFPHLWNLGDWLRLALDVSILWLASRYMPHEPGKLAFWILPVLALAMMGALAAGAMGVQLVVAAQLHRVQWLAHLLALALAVPLCQQLWKHGPAWDRYLAIGVASSLVFPFALGGILLPLMYGLYRWAVERLPQGPEKWNPALVMFMIVLLLGFALWLFDFALGLSLRNPGSGRPAWLAIITQAPVAMGIFLGGYALSRRIQFNKGWLYLYGASLLVVGVVYWDQRKPWGVDYDQPERTAAIAPVQAIIPKHAVVYWESRVYVTPDDRASLDRGFVRAWFWLQRASYASFEQAAGNVFYRQTAFEIARRIEHLRHWKFRGEFLDWKNRNKIPETFSLNEARLKGVCSDPILDFVITDTRLPSASLGFKDPLTERRFSVYDCRKLRSI